MLALEQNGLEEAFNESMKPVKDLINSRFESMKLKEEFVECKESASSDAVEHLKESINLVDNEIDLLKLTAADLKKCSGFSTFLEKHCKSTCYGFQIKKCRDSNCPFCSCLQPIRLPEEIFDQLSFLPNPVLDSSKEHYKQFSKFIWH